MEYGFEKEMKYRQEYSMYRTLKELAEAIEQEMMIREQLEGLEEMIQEYKGEDWKEYKQYCDYGYKRNMVHKGERVEILIICWKIGQYAAIHDHPKNGCILKILKGKLTEKKYKMTEDKELICYKEQTLKRDEYSYQEGEEGLHEMKNEGEECVISLHIYSPVNYTPKFYKK